MKKILLAVFAAIFCLSAVARAESLAFASLLGDNMVLQQRTDARIWGSASRGATVSISTTWLDQPLTAKADAHGRWEVFLPTPDASFTPQTITAVCGSERIQATNVLIGEVWFCSGQSNMEMTLGGGFGTPVEGALDEIAMARQYKGVRYLAVQKDRAVTPKEDAKGIWEECNPTTAPHFSAVGYFFASRLSRALEVPVGIINASWGGSVIEAWMSRELLADCPDVDLANASNPEVNDMYKPMIMYNAMFKPINIVYTPFQNSIL